MPYLPGMRTALHSLHLTCPSSAPLHDVVLRKCLARWSHGVQRARNTNTILAPSLPQREYASRRMEPRENKWRLTSYGTCDYSLGAVTGPASTLRTWKDSQRIVVHVYIARSRTPPPTVAFGRSMPVRVKEEENRRRTAGLVYYCTSRGQLLLLGGNNLGILVCRVGRCTRATEDVARACAHFESSAIVSSLPSP